MTANFSAPRVAMNPSRGHEPTQTAFRFVDLFAGISGIRLGFEAAGGRCVYSVEIDRLAP